MPHTDITGIHHVGVLVDDLSRAMADFERLGFTVKSPAYAALPPAPGRQPQPIGATNTHADFRRGFLELVAIAPETRDRLPEGAEVIELAIPAERREETMAAMRATVANIAERLRLGEGAHILVFSTSDAEATADRLTEVGIGHGGAHAVQRPIVTDSGTTLADIRYLEVDGDDPASPTGLVPEGRVGIVEDAPAELLDAQAGLSHPNGATGLVEVVISVDGEPDPTVDRYRRYLATPPTVEDAAAVFRLPNGRVVITTADRFAAEYPGQCPPSHGTASRLAACTVEVADLPATRRYLGERGVVLGRGADGRPFIPAEAASGLVITLGGSE